jgi:WD40 repeat protein
MKNNATNFPDINIQSDNINFQEKILHIKWCPTMDLLAIINNSYKLTIYRSTWVEDKFVLQKVWSINSTICQSSIEWRPDGKIIAIGYVDGSLKLIDVETSQIAYSMPYYTENTYITSMTWIEEINKNGINDEVLKRI